MHQIYNDNKGFTLVEILSTIVIIALLIGIGVPGVMQISKRMKFRSYETKIDLVERAGELWGQDNKALLGETECTIDGVTYKCKKVKIKDLIIADYLDSESKEANSFISPVTNKEIIEECVYVYKKNNRVYSCYDRGHQDIDETSVDRCS